MQFRRILIILMVMIFMTGTLSAEAAAPTKSTALEPWDSEVVDMISEGYVGPFVSIDHYERNGRAYISYYDAENHYLKLAYQVDPGTGNCPGNTNWKCETVDNGGPYVSQHDVGQYNSIDVLEASVNLTASIQGELELAPPQFHYAKIGISYYDETDASLKFALRTCNSPFVCSWNITEVDDDEGAISSNVVGQFSSFNFGSEDQPIIYYNERNVLTNLGRVKRAYLPSGNTFSGNCDSSWNCQVIAQAASSAFGTHISADGGRVVFYDGSPNYEMYYARPVSVDTATCGVGLSRWDCQEIDSQNNVGKFSSLYYDGVNPMQIAYYDASNGTVKYAIQTSAGSGNCTNNSFNCDAVDDIGASTTNTSVGISLTLDAQNQPIIAYQDFHEEMAPATLKLARPSTVYGNLVGNCGDPPNGYLFQYWHCRLLDSSGHQEVDEADYAAISVNPTGLATVAYYESDEYYSEGRLKVAQQHFGIYLPLISK